MSPLWRDQLLIALSPDRVDLVRLGKGLRRRVTAKLSVPCEAGLGWQPAIAAMNKLLAKQGNADVGVVLSSRFAHYVIVPWSDAVSGTEELGMLARHRCSQVYGTLAADWEVHVSPSKFGVPMLACGMERALLGALRQTCEGARLHLVSVQPLLMAAFNRWSGSVNDNGGWFGIAEGGRLTLALAHGGGWHAVQSRHIDGALAAALAGMLEQEKLLAGLADVPRTAWIFAPEQPNLAVSGDGKWSVHVLKLPALEGYSPHGDAVFGLALAGAK